MTNRIYVDKLTVRSVFFLLCHSNYSVVSVLEGKGIYFSSCRLILSVFQKQINIVDFSFSTLRNAEGNSAYIDTIRKTTNYSVKLVDEAFRNNASLQLIDNELDRPFLRLVSLKIAQQVLFPTFLRLAAFNSQKKAAGDKLLLTAPGLGLEEHLRNSDEFENTIILSSLKNTIRLWFNFWFKLWVDYQRNKLFVKFLGYPRRPFEESKNPSVLLVQEDDVHDDLSYRRQPIWNSLSSESYGISTLILKNHISKKLFTENDVDLLKTKDVFIIDYENVFAQDVGNLDEGLKSKLSKLSPIFSQAINNVRRQNCLSSFSKLIAYRAKLSTLLAMRLSVLMYRNKTKAILLGDVYHHFSEISFLCSSLSGIPVISYQYSSLWLTSPPMLSIADFHLIFSKLYKKIYQLGPIQPKKFCEAGYSHLTVKEELQNRSSQLRMAMQKNGVQTIISYFDETFFRGDKWALVDEKFYFDELEVIFKFIIKNSKFGLILKPQFLHNSLEKNYYHIPFVAEGFSTGRIIELCHGYKRRNLVLPAEAGLASDFSICSKIGMTTAIELASLGRRAILLDNHGILTPFDNILDKVDVQYKSIEKIIEKIIESKGQPDETTLGDWATIIPDFVVPSGHDSCSGLEVFVKCIVDKMQLSEINQ